MARVTLPATLAAAAASGALLLACTGIALADSTPAPTGPGTAGCAQAEQTVTVDAGKANAADALVAKVTADLAAYDKAEHDVAVAADAYGKVGDPGHTAANLAVLDAAKKVRDAAEHTLLVDSGAASVNAARNVALPNDVKAQTAAHATLDAAVAARNTACAAPAPTTSAAPTGTTSATATNTASETATNTAPPVVLPPLPVTGPTGTVGTSQVAQVPNGINTGRA